MKSMNFTKRNIEAIEPPAKGFLDIKDTANKYLRIRTTAAGNQTFYFVRFHKTKPYYKALGRFPDINVAQAREKCDKENAALLSGGAQKPKKLILDELFDSYLENQAKPHKKTWKDDQQNFNRYIKPLAKKQVVDIDCGDIAALHARIGKEKGKYTANRSLALLKTVFNYGRRNLSLKIENPCDGVKMFKEQSRDRFLNKEELQAFFKAVMAEQTPRQWQDFFLLCLWTGARRSNVQAMRWENVDLNNAIWRIAGSEFKNKDNFQVVLIEPALEILTRRKHEVDNQSPYVFPANSKTGHIQEPRKQWESIVTRANLTNVRLHDLRRTLGSWQAATGASLQVIGKTLGHKNQATTAIYSRLNLDPVRESLNTATTAMLAAMNGNEK